MSIQEVLELHLRKKAIPGKIYTAKDKDGIVKNFKGQSDGGLRITDQSTSTPVSTSVASILFTELDPVFTAWLAGPPNVSLFTNDAGYLTSLAGAVTSVTGTANRVTSTGGATPVIDIDSAYDALWQPIDSDLTSWAAVTRASGFDTFTATPSSANLAALLTDETGTGAAVFANAPTLVNPVVGTQAANDNSTKAASTAYVDAKKDYGLLINTALGSVILAQSIRVNEINNNNALADGQVQFFAVYLPVAATLTGVKFYQRVQGNYTSDNYNGIGLYSYSGGTLTLVASSTDDGNIWKGTASSWQTKAFTATYAASAGVYFIAYLYNSSVQVTAPTLGSQTNLTSAAGVTLDYTNSAKLMSSLAGQTALPASQASSGLTSSTVMYYGGLY